MVPCLGGIVDMKMTATLLSHSSEDGGELDNSDTVWQIPFKVVLNVFSVQREGNY